MADFVSRGTKLVSTSIISSFWLKNFIHIFSSQPHKQYEKTWQRCFQNPSYLWENWHSVLTLEALWDFVLFGGSLWIRSFDWPLLTAKKKILFWGLFDNVKNNYWEKIEDDSWLNCSIWVQNNIKLNQYLLFQIARLKAVEDHTDLLHDPALLHLYK